jgi:hypothetical protein
MVNNADKIVIYWAPAHGLGHSYDFSHLYPFPKSLFDELSTKKTNPKQNTDDYLRCPAVRHKLKKIFVIRSSTNTKVKIIDGQGISYETLSENDNRRHQTTIESIHNPTLENQMLLNYSHPIIFFADSPSLVASLTPPYFHQTTHSAFGAIVPGEFDVSNWFRAMNFEFQLWQGVNELHVPADEPIGYVEFQTDRQIELRRFKLTNGLNRLSSSLIHVSPHRRFAKLSEKYKLFKNANISKGILREIQDNLMD